MTAKTDEEYLKLVVQEMYKYRSSLNTKELGELRTRTEKNCHFFSDEIWEKIQTIEHLIYKNSTFNFKGGRLGWWGGGAASARWQAQTNLTPSLYCVHI